MPAAYAIDVGRALVLSRFWGVLTDRNVLTHVHALRTDTRFRPHLLQLADFRFATEVDVTNATIRKIAGLNPFGAGSRRAFVVSSDLAYGLARMYQALTSDALHELRIIRDVHEALEWLALSKAKAELLAALAELPPLPDTEPAL